MRLSTFNKAVEDLQESSAVNRLLAFGLCFDIVYAGDYFAYILYPSKDGVSCVPIVNPDYIFPTLHTLFCCLHSPLMRRQLYT
jgi:hypothetical protein